MHEHALEHALEHVREHARSMCARALTRTHAHSRALTRTHARAQVIAHAWGGAARALAHGKDPRLASSRDSSPTTDIRVIEPAQPHTWPMITRPWHQPNQIIPTWTSLALLALPTSAHLCPPLLTHFCSLLHPFQRIRPQSSHQPAGIGFASPGYDFASDKVLPLMNSFCLYNCLLHDRLSIFPSFST